MVPMNEEQLQFVRDTEFQYTKLYGVPGGGKTRCIIEKILYLKEIGFLEGYQDYLVLTFSRQACEDFIRKGKKRSRELFREGSIRTIHSTCASLLKHRDGLMNLSTMVYECLEGLRALPSGAEGLRAVGAEGSKALPYCAEGSKASVPYCAEGGWPSSIPIQQKPLWKHKKVIFVDEAQDISQLQYDLVIELGKVYGCPVLLIGDPNQNIFQFQNGSDRFLLEHTGKAIHLKKNYRSSADIVRFINQFRPWDIYGRITPVLGEGKRPLLVVDSKEDVLGHLVRDILRVGRRFEEIAIIAPIKLSKRNAISLSMVSNELFRHNIPFVKHYQDNDSDHSFHHTKEIVEGHVNLFTIHGSKGLEFERVYLCNFHLDTKGFLPTKEEHYENRYLWYVGMSRAKHSLTMYALRDCVLFPSIYSCPKELYKFLGEGVLEPRGYFFQEKKKEFDYIPIKNLLTSKTWMDEPELYKLHKLFEYKKTEEDIFHVPVELYEYSQYATIYGMFMDDWMFYQTVPIYHYIHCKEKQVDWKVPLRHDLWKRIQSLQKKNKNKKICSYASFLDCMDAENSLDRAILRELDKKEEYYEEFFEFCSDKGVVEYDKKVYLGYLEKLKGKGEEEGEGEMTTFEKIGMVWNIVLFQYQQAFECKYIMTQDFSNHWITLLPYVVEVSKMKKFNSNTLFQIPLVETDIGLKGVMDALDDKNNIYEFKFCKETDLPAFLQVFLYATIYYKHLLHKKVELWNLQTGKRYVCEFLKDTTEEVIAFLEGVVRLKGNRRV